MIEISHNNNRHGIGAKVLLVDPGYGRNGFRTWAQSHWSSVVHHGLCSISAYLKNRGHSVSLLDIRTLKDYEQFRDYYKHISPEIVGITFRSADHHTVEEIVSNIRMLDSKVRIVLGGAHPTADPEEASSIPGVDHAIVGEGEISFAKLTENINASFPKIIIGEHPDLNELPFEDRDLYDIRVSMNLPNYPGHLKPPMITMITCRGCAFLCKFCAPHAQNTFGGKMKYQNVDRVIEEIKQIDKKFGHVETLKFYNSDFPASAKWVYDFCDALEKAKIKKKLMIQSRATSIAKDEELVARLKSVGLKLILFGFESGSQRILDILKKGCRVEDNIRAAEICKKHNVVFGASWMFGIPGETPKDIWDTVAVAKQINAHYNSAAYFTPLPGTYLYDYVKENDLSLIEDWDDLYNFMPDKPKVKGVDYKLAESAAGEILMLRLGGSFGKLARYIYAKTKPLVYLRHKLIYVYSKYTTNPLIRWLRGN